MGKTDQFIKTEKDKYGKIFVDINYAISSVSPFLDKDDLNIRKYAAKISILKKYIDLIEEAEREFKNTNFLNKLKSTKYISPIKDYKNDNYESLLQLEKCSTCECLNCTAPCNFDSCLGCKSASKIVHCDRKRINASKYDAFFVNLINNTTGKNDRYVVLSTLQDVQLNKRYIIIENIALKEKFILYYYPGISEDSYGEISNSQEFDFIVSTFQSIEE
ncbi:hypothetical protein [Clostridium kluyveri]|uniref:DUF1292 domain-containing protein n=2 Tax=Clostridium kluyveri TaxID=1534 RepID=A5N3R7_CLOK5|nr:hypothetical protein [Clostridium kluyveri]EDK35763.1 Conserved hypothetical protein [Clostridium kluyveri DSM 555]BAH08391.1 hypothetical protein CKR_3340 [Clostridium kluyveri NBRC 12016]